MERHGSTAHSRAREDASRVFERLSKLDCIAAMASGARRGPSDSAPFFRLSEAAHDDFLNWRSDLEKRMRTDECRQRSKLTSRKTANWYRRSR